MGNKFWKSIFGFLFMSCFLFFLLVLAGIIHASEIPDFQLIKMVLNLILFTAVFYSAMKYNE